VILGEPQRAEKKRLSQSRSRSSDLEILRFGDLRNRREQRKRGFRRGDLRMSDVMMSDGSRLIAHGSKLIAHGSKLIAHGS